VFAVAGLSFHIGPDNAQGHPFTQSHGMAPPTIDMRRQLHALMLSRQDSVKSSVTLSGNQPKTQVANNRLYG
jgi:hypothetical protein